MKTLVEALIITLILATPAIAQDVNSDGVVTYLIPVSAPTAVQGANGSLWQTELWVHNSNEFPFRLRGCGTVIFEPPPCSVPFHEPFSTEQAYSHELFSPVPALLYDVIETQRVILSSRLFELSKHTQPAGVELPIVREDEFWTRSALFIAVPAARTARVALRLYNPRPRTPASVKAEFIVGANTVASTVIDIPETLERDWPGYAALFDVVDSFPALAAHERFDVRLSPVGSTGEYWAIVSVTDQTQQQMLLISGSQQ